MANESGIMLEFPYTLEGPTGTKYWLGCGRLINSFIAINAEASTAMAAGDALSYDVSTIIQPFDYATTNAALRQFLNTKLATTTGTLDVFAGVAMESAPAGSQVIVAGHGSVVNVKATANGARRDYLIASATAGQVTPQSTAPTAPATSLGRVLKIRGTSGGSTDSGSAAMVLAVIGI